MWNAVFKIFWEFLQNLRVFLLKFGNYLWVWIFIQKNANDTREKQNAALKKIGGHYE